MTLQRRHFIQTGATVGLAELLGPNLWAALNESMTDTSSTLPRRPLGKTGERLSVIGLGGIVVMGGTQDDANNRVAEAVDRGVNYFDISPNYGKGEAQEKLGPALKPYRDKSFIACKTSKRDKVGAAAELRASLKDMQTDRFDLYQMHAISDVEADVERALAPGGAMEAFIEAKEQGLVRFLGVSAHSVEAALKAIETGLFDTILYPVNFACHFQNQFDEAPLAAAKAKGMGTLALKSMARTEWTEGLAKDKRSNPKCWYEPLNDPAEAALALRWTLSRGVTAALPPGDERLFRLALNVASKETPLTPPEEQALRQIASGVKSIFPRPPKKAKPRGPIKVGDRAPDFALPKDAQARRLSDLEGKKNVLLAFYPKVFTGGCTKQLCGYRDDYAQFRAADTEIVAISLDEQAESSRFRDEYKMPFIVLGDTSKRVAEKYGIPLKKNRKGGEVAQRAVVLIDKQGIVRHVDLEYNIQSDKSPLYAEIKQIGS